MDFIEPNLTCCHIFVLIFCNFFDVQNTSQTHPHHLLSQLQHMSNFGHFSAKMDWELFLLPFYIKKISDQKVILLPLSSQILIPFTVRDVHKVTLHHGTRKTMDVCHSHVFPDIVNFIYPMCLKLKSWSTRQLKKSIIYIHTFLYSNSVLLHWILVLLSTFCSMFISTLFFPKYIWNIC